MFDFASDLANLAVPVAPKKSNDAANVILFDPRLFPKRPIPPEGIESLAEGITREEMPPLDWAPLVKTGGCAFIREALRIGGKDYSQPMWNLTTLAATFLADGEKLAHRMGNQHPTYTPEETKAMWERKLRERQNNEGLGWPSCNAIQAAGCTSCAACPHLAKGKSPLNLAIPVAPTAGPIQANNRNLPDPLDFHQVPEEEAIARVNAAGYFVLTLNGDIYKMEASGAVNVQKREGFTNLFACRRASLDNGELISAGTAWKNSSDRREYDRIGYWPGNHGRPSKSYNLWREWGIEPKQGDWSIIRDHILLIANGDKDKANYILDWSAHMVQRPWEKPNVALVLRGRKGTGKTLLTQILARVVGRSNTLITANGKKLFEKFNWHLADKLLVGAEEAFFVGNRELNDQLKHLLTGDEIEVEQKYGQRISMKSMHRVIMTSNHDQVVAASADERRFFVCDVSDKRRGDDSYFAPLVRMIKGDDNATLAAFMYELQTRDITNWKPEQAARKAASSDLARQKLLSLEPPLQWLLEEETAARGLARREAKRKYAGRLSALGQERSSPRSDRLH